MKNSSNRLIFPTFVCMEGSADKIFEVLKRYWGFTEFRPVQERIIRSAMAGRDTLALMPTGGGKSLTYQVPGLAQPGLCIVVTPLIALMKDQVDRLRARRIPAVAIHSGLSPRQIDIALDNCVYGDVKFLYVAPERLATEAFRLRVQRAVCVIGPRKAKPRKQQRENFLRRRRFSLLDLGKIRRAADPAAKPLLAPSARKALAANQKPRNAHRSPPFFPSISYLTGKENPYFLARRRRTRSPACFFHNSPVAFATQSKSGKYLAFLTKNDIIIIALFGCFTREIYEIQRRISQCPLI